MEPDGSGAGRVILLVLLGLVSAFIGIGIVILGGVISGTDLPAARLLAPLAGMAVLLGGAVLAWFGGNLIIRLGRSGGCRSKDPDWIDRLIHGRARVLPQVDGRPLAGAEGMGKAVTHIEGLLALNGPRLPRSVWLP